MDTRRVKTWKARLMLVLAFAFLLAIMAEPAYAVIFRFTVRMNGNQEVPPVAPAGTAVARIMVDTVTRGVIGNVTFTGLSAPSTAGHFHLAAAGVNGPIIVPLAGGIGVTAGRMRVPVGSVFSVAQMTALRGNRVYLNLHTSAHPGGEIRGQIRWATRVRIASVDRVPMVRLVSLGFDPMPTGIEMAGLNSGGGIFATLGMGTWMETSGDIIRLGKEDLDRDGVVNLYD